jgi:hypothetical protein
MQAKLLQHVTCLTLLDLTAAFDIIYHSILLEQVERLSPWFGIIYLLNRTFPVNIEGY